MNQISPGLNGGNGVFDVQNGGKIGPNNALLNKDFPFHELADPADRDSLVLFDTDDVASSACMFASDFNDVIAGNAIDECTPVADVLPFELNNGLHTRQVGPPNTPTIINAAFNDRNFWAGRANNTSYTLLTDAKTLLEELNYPAALGSRMTAPGTQRKSRACIA